MAALAGPVVVLLGSPGVGKGTQGARLGATLGWAHLSTGDLLRQALREETELGLRARSFMDRGDLVPDDVMIGLVRNEIVALGRERGVILDGFPRTAAQAEALDAMLADEGRAVAGVALLEADAQVLFRRISGRRSSPSGRIYNIHFDPPRREGICDDTGEPLVHRADDQPETVRSRLDVYRRETAPLIGYYEERGALVRIDGEGAIDEVQAALLTATEVWVAVSC